MAVISVDIRVGHHGTPRRTQWRQGPAPSAATGSSARSVGLCAGYGPRERPAHHLRLRLAASHGCSACRCRLANLCPSLCLPA